MRRLGLISSYKCGDNTNGRLIIPVTQDDGSVSEMDLDFERNDIAFCVTMNECLWNHIKQFGFADSLKDAAIYLFGLPEELVFGDETARNTLTEFDWSAFNSKKSGKLTVREFLQEFAKRVRQIDADRFVKNTLKAIQQRNSKLSLIKDVRHKNEVAAIKKSGGLVVRLTRKIDNDNDVSESQLDSYTDFDLVIDNQNMTIDEQNLAILEFANDRNLLP